MTTDNMPNSANFQYTKYLMLESYHFCRCVYHWSMDVSWEGTSRESVRTRAAE